LPGSILIWYLELVGEDKLGITFYLEPGRHITLSINVGTAIGLIFGPLYVGAILYAASQLKQGLGANYHQCMTYAVRRSLQLLGTRTIAGFIILGGLIALVIPGVILALRFALVDAIVILEGVGGTRALNLSAKMSQGKKWSLLGAITLAFIGVIGALYLVTALVSLTGQHESSFAISVITSCIGVLLLQFPVFVTFLFYWEAKCQALVANRQISMK
jgi:uncharacterized membrane protein